MSELLVEDVRVSYGDTAALDGFSLRVPSGEIMAVVGPSGSGKSTLLRAVAGLEPLAGGRVTLGGQDLSRVPTHKRNLGLMFQDHGLFGHLSVADNIAYGLRIAGMSKPARRNRVSDLLKLVDLDGFGPRATSELSGGEAQRVALARALAPQPALLMLDEPLGSLDRALRDQLTGDLRRLLTSLGQTALHVTHDQAEAFALADRVAVVADGRPVAVGTPAELWADPGSRFVAEFLGHSNIWSVSVDGAGAVVWANQLLGHLPQDHALRACEAGECLAVMPAAGLRVDHSANGAGRCRLAVTVTESVFRRGVHDVSAVMDSARSEWPLTFTTPESVRVGDSLALSVDVAALRPLTDP